MSESAWHTNPYMDNIPPVASEFPLPPQQPNYLPSEEDRKTAVVIHLSGLLATLISAGSLGFLAPLIAWFIYKDSNPYLRKASASAFNFFLANTIVMWVAGILMFTVVLIPLSIVAIVVALIAGIVCPILAAGQAHQGNIGRYWYSIPALQ